MPARKKGINAGALIPFNFKCLFFRPFVQRNEVSRRIPEIRAVRARVHFLHVGDEFY